MATMIDLTATQLTLRDVVQLAQSGAEVVLLVAGQAVATVRPVEAAPAPEPIAKRRAGLQPDAFSYVAEDFDTPLTESFWPGGDP